MDLDVIVAQPLSLPCFLYTFSRFAYLSTPSIGSWYTDVTLALYLPSHSALSLTCRALLPLISLLPEKQLN